MDKLPSARGHELKLPAGGSLPRQMMLPSARGHELKQIFGAVRGAGFCCPPREGTN